MEQQSEFSAAPVSDEQLVAWPRVAAVSSMVSFSLPTFITGLEVYQALTISDALWAMLIASILLTVVGGTMGAIGARSRMSSYLLVRIAFGNKGAGLVNMAFALSLMTILTAHELGHLFGLRHTKSRDNIMCSCRSGPMVRFTTSQCLTMRTGARRFAARQAHGTRSRWADRRRRR